MPIPALAELQQPQPLSPTKLKAQALPVACDEGFDFSGNKSSSGDKSHPDTVSCQSAAVHQQCGAEQNSLAFSILIRYHTTVLTKWHIREPKDQLKQEKKAANILNRAKSLNILQALTCVISSWVEVHRWTAQFFPWSHRSDAGLLAFWWRKSCNFCFCLQPVGSLKQL